MNSENKKCLITGGASFIGSHLAERLVKNGVKVRIADDLSSGNLLNLSSIRNDIEFYKGDLREFNFALKATKGVETVFHLAADHGGRGYIDTHPANCTRNMALDNIVFMASEKNNVEQIVFTSSACVYPQNIQENKVLLREDMVSFDRPDGTFADGEYGWAKLMGELSLKAYFTQYGIKSAIVRLCTGYGPRENESHAIIALIAKSFIRQPKFEIWGKGEQSRGFTYIDDIVNGIILAAKNISDGTAVNIGTDEFITINQVADEIFKIVGWYPEEGIKYLKNKPVGVKHRALDFSYSESRIGWKPKVRLKEGLTKTIDWYFQNKSQSEIRKNLESLLKKR